MSAEIGPLGLTGEQYWRNPEEHAGSIISSRLIDEADGMLVDAPPSVDLAKHSSIPILCHRSGSTRKLYYFNLSTTTYLVVSHLETGAIQAVKLGETPAIRSTPMPSPGWTTDWLEQDLAQWNSLGPKLGKYAVWAACGPEASNIRVLDIFNGSHPPASHGYHARIRDLNASGTIAYMPDSKNDFAFKNFPYPEAPLEHREWSLRLEKNSTGIPRLRLRFRVIGLPGFVFPNGKAPANAQGKIIQAHLPALVFGFGKDRLLTVLSQLDIPIHEKPLGTREHPIISGDVSFGLPDFGQPDILSSAQDIWIAAMDHRAHVQVQPLPTK